MKAWILLSAFVILSFAHFDYSFQTAQGSNSTNILPPENSEDLTSEERVLIKLTPSQTTAQANVSPKDIKVKVGTTIVWQNMLPEKVYVQSKPDENHYVGELLNGSYFFPSESREAKLNKIGTFIYDGSNGFGSYYVRGTITVVQEATEKKGIPVEIVTNQNANNDAGSVTNDLMDNMIDYQGPDLGIAFKYPSSWPNPTYPDYQNCFKNSDTCNVSFPLVYQNENYIIGVGVNKLFTNSEPELITGNTCFCASLQDYIKWDYDRLYKENEFLQDGQTSLANSSSWQMDVLDKDNGYKTLVTWALNDNFGYRFIYSAPGSDHFDYYLKEYKSLLDSVKFTGVEIKEPSAVTESKEPSAVTESKEPSAVTESKVSKRPSFLSGIDINDSPVTSSKVNETSIDSTYTNVSINASVTENNRTSEQITQIPSDNTTLEQITQIPSDNTTSEQITQIPSDNTTSEQVTENVEWNTSEQVNQIPSDNTTSEQVTENVEWKTYENPTFGVKINYPSDWTFENQETEIDRATYRGDVDGQTSIVDFKAPPNTGTEAEVTLEFYNIPQDTTLNDFVKGEIEDRGESVLFGTTYPGWSVIEQTKTTFSNHSAEKVIFGQESSNSRWFFIYGIINGKGYSIDYQDGYPTPYNLYIDEVEKIADSFLVTGSALIDKPIQWVEFKDESLGISLEYPSGWEIERKESKFDEGPEVMISDNSESNFGELKILKPITADSSFFDAEFATDTAQSGIYEREGARVIEEVDMNKYEVDGNEAGTFLYTYTSSFSDYFPDTGNSLSSSTSSLFDLEYAQQMLLTVYKNKVYAFAFEADIDEFDIYSDTMDHMFKSIKFTN